MRVRIMVPMPPAPARSTSYAMARHVRGIFLAALQLTIQRYSIAVNAGVHC